jgi:hypothetical protein
MRLGWEFLTLFLTPINNYYFRNNKILKGYPVVGDILAGMRARAKSKPCQSED